MQGFELLLKNEKTKQYNQIAFFVILINLFTFFFIAVSINDREIRIATIFATALLFIALIIDSLLQPMRKNEDSPYKFIAENVIAGCWVLIGYWWLGVFFFILGLLYVESKRKHIVL